MPDEKQAETKKSTKEVDPDEEARKHYVREDGVEIDLTDSSDEYRLKLAKEGKI